MRPHYFQAEDYVKAKTGSSVNASSLGADAVWTDVLTAASLTAEQFLADQYPDLKESPEELFAILVAQNPDSVLLTDYAFAEDGDDSSSCEATTTEDPTATTATTASTAAPAAPTCPDGLVYDDLLAACYSALDGGANHTRDSSSDACWEFGQASTIDSFYNDEELVRAKALILNAASE